MGGTYLSLLGPAATMCFGICTYAVYVGSLWYYEATGAQSFPLAAGAVICVGAGAVFITSGYIQVAYSSDGNKGKFIAVQNTLQATGSIACSILPVILNRDNVSRAGVPIPVYITYITVMLAAAALALFALRRPNEVTCDSGAAISDWNEKRGRFQELAENLAVFKEWKLLCLLPAFLPAGSFLIYLGSVNAFQNNLRARSLLSFIALVVQIPFGHLLHIVLDRPAWPRRKRGLAGLAFVGIPLSVAWVWEIIRTRAFDRSSPPVKPVDWSDSEYGPIMVLFVLNWTASVLWQYLVPWFIGALGLPPEKLSHYMGVQRGFLAAGEAIYFGADAARIPYVAFSGAVFGFYAAGIGVLAYFCLFHMTEPRLSMEDVRREGSFDDDKTVGLRVACESLSRQLKDIIEAGRCTGAYYSI